MSLALANYQWADALIRCLSLLGCEHFFIAPGSRNAPLSMSCLRFVREHPHLHGHTHFDERSLAFAALGAAKAGLKPTVVITSSGSAVANLLPAVVEAHHTDTPLILLTADRPPELVGCGANQAIVQPGLFSHFTSTTLNLPLPPAENRASALEQLLHQLQACLAASPGPIHLNVPLREPLYSIEAPLPAMSLPEITNQAGADHPPAKPIEVVTAPILLIAGQLTEHEADTVLTLAEQLQAPIFADIGSQLRQRIHPLIMPLSHYLCSERPELLADIKSVVQFGGHLTSKPLMQWLDGFNGRYLLLTASPAPLDPTGHAHQIQLPPNNWLSKVRSDSSSTGLVESLREVQADLQAVVYQQVQQTFSEYSCCAELSRLIPEQQLVFLGNSLTIRLFDQMAIVSDAPATVFTNRGASGIDGLIATAAGIALVRHQPVTIVVGDLAALYDLNSLYWLTRSPVPITLVILNNDGGQIFKMLPAAEQTDVFNDAFQQAHGLNFEQFARGFGLDYQAVYSLDDLTTAYPQAIAGGSSNLIEICLPDTAFKEHQQKIRRALDEHAHV